MHGGDSGEGRGVRPWESFTGKLNWPQPVEMGKAEHSHQQSVRKPVRCCCGLGEIWDLFKQNFSQEAQNLVN